METSVHFDHPDGIKLPFCENLCSYLRNRADETGLFRIGDWLASLDDVEISQLSFQTELVAADDGATNIDDIVALSIIGIAAEKGKNEPLDEEQVTRTVETLATVVAIESLARRGWLELLQPLSLSRDAKFEICITEKGLQTPEFLAQHRGRFFQ
jgi:hypothetical protein